MSYSKIASEGRKSVLGQKLAIIRLLRSKTQYSSDKTSEIYIMPNVLTIHLFSRTQFTSDMENEV